MGWHMGGWGPGWGFAGGPGWGWMALAHALWLLLVIGGAALIVRWAWRRGGEAAGSGDADRALAVLRERYARGEIDDAEFDRRKAVLRA